MLFVLVIIEHYSQAINEWFNLNNYFDNNMKNLVEIDKSNIADFLESFVDSGVKILDEINLFEKDELFAAIPYGKLVGFIDFVAWLR